MVDLGASEPLPHSRDDRLALAWALKDQCHASWSSEPRRACDAAQALRRLQGEDPSARDDPVDTEIDALVHWTQGIAAIITGQMQDALHSLDAAAATFLALRRDDHAAHTQVPKIMALSMLGRLDEAAECGESTLRELVAQRDLQAAGKVSLNLGSLHLMRDAYAPAVARYREAAVLFARVGDHEHSVMADIGLANVLTEMGDFEESLRIYARARMRAGTHGFPVLEAMVDGSVALLDLSRGRYRDALAGFERFRGRYESLGMPQHLVIAEKQLADAYLELRLLPEAIDLFSQALTKFESLDMPNEQAWTLTQLGRAHALMSRRPAAVDAFGRAAELFGAQQCRVGAAAVALARAELSMAGHDADADAALDLARQAVAAFDAAGHAEGAARAGVVVAQGLRRSGDAVAAAAHFEATLQRAMSLGLLPVQVRCLTGLGQIARSRGDVVAARVAFDGAIERFEDQRRVLPGDEIRGAFQSDHLLPYEELLRFDLQAHAQAPTPRHAETVLLSLDRIRARVLHDRANRIDAVPEDATAARLRSRLNWLYRRAVRSDDDTAPSSTLTAELRRTEADLLELARRHRLSTSVPDEPMRADDDRFDLGGLRRQLGQDTALVEYGVLDDELFACLVTDSGVTVHRRMAHWPAVVDAVRALRFQLETLRHGNAQVMSHLATLTERTWRRLQTLHRLLWEPLVAAIGATRRVLIVPHAQLGSLPFASLHDGAVTLAERHELAVVPSARLALRGLQRRLAEPVRALVLGESSRLAHAGSEARFVAGLFPGGRAFVGDEASLACLSEHAGDADVIHLACHAEFRPDNPMFSALHLADGALTVELAESLRLKPGIVVLSACETALAEQGSGDEMIGLVRAFLGAGAARVLAALWPVDDAVTEQFMARFYGALRRGDGPSAALRHAQTETMRQHPHPFYWAAFALHGGC
jgi:tetratricopeptide (TPR) repeat protein